MSDFVEQLRLAERAAENIYFAKVNRQLIEAIRKRMQSENGSFQPSDEVTADATAQCSDCAFSVHLDQTSPEDVFLFCIHTHKGRVGNWCGRIVEADDEPCEHFKTRQNNPGAL